MNSVSLPEQSRIYAIGDIHGRADLVDRIAEEILRDMEADPIDRCVTVTIGDYIDRGPDSRGVLDRLVRNPFPTELVALKGNHEDLFETFLRDPSIADDWRRVGGLETLHSYGIAVAPLMMGKNYNEAADALRLALPPAHLEFLGLLKTSVAAGKYFLCHAGVRPGVPLEQQSEEDLLWIRTPFLESRADFGKIVVHGHTPTEKPEVLPNRINIDTAAFMTGRLTCAVLEPERVRFLST
jgi:serine/threonine protein phosphatase 1